MSRYRLLPTDAQEAAMLEHCAHARYVWNLAVEQHSHWRSGWKSAPNYLEQARQLTEARREFPWLATGSVNVQQQALRDFGQAMSNYFRGTHRRPTWRKAGRNDGFRQVAHKPHQRRRLNRRHGEVWVAKVGWVRFLWSRQVAPEAKSFRVTRDRKGRWHLAFAVVPATIAGPGDGSVAGVDRGVAVSAAVSTGELLKVPGLRDGERRRLIRLRRRLARSARGSNRRNRAKAAIATLVTREVDRRKDWTEKVSTDLARRFDLIRVENLDVRNMVRSARGTTEQPGRNVRQKTGLNRSILANAWARLVSRLEHKAAGRVEKVDPRFTSRRCSACGHVAAENRESQAVFRCVSCGATGNADVNAACNIAAGRAVTARGALQPLGGALNREPHPASFVA